MPPVVGNATGCWQCHRLLAMTHCRYMSNHKISGDEVRSSLPLLILVISPAVALELLQRLILPFALHDTAPSANITIYAEIDFRSSPCAQFASQYNSKRNPKLSLKVISIV